jgi:hypothetical protein
MNDICKNPWRKERKMTQRRSALLLTGLALLLFASTSVAQQWQPVAPPSSPAAPATLPPLPFPAPPVRPTIQLVSEPAPALPVAPTLELPSPAMPLPPQPGTPQLLPSAPGLPALPSLPLAPGPAQPVITVTQQAMPTAPAVPLPPAAPLSPPAPATEGWMPELLKRLPLPPDQMGSLYAPKETEPYACTAPKPPPYFQQDPLLNPPNMPQVGWFASLQMEAAAPHVFKSIIDPVTAGGRPTDTVALPNRNLDWTYVPRVEFGYNLPSGFGGFALSYLFFASSGNANVVGPDGVAPLHSRIDLNQGDFDYITKEFTPNDTSDSWTMRWRFGVRLASLYYDSVLNQAPATAAAGTGILQQRAYNQFLAVGPHIGLELTHTLGMVPGLSVLGKVDVASLFGGLNQGVSEVAYDPTTPGGIAFGNSFAPTAQTAPTVMMQLGLDWHPPSMCGVHVFAGYEYQYWWNVGRLSVTPDSRGDLSFQGIMMRFEYNY